MEAIPAINHAIRHKYGADHSRELIVTCKVGINCGTVLMCMTTAAGAPTRIDATGEPLGVASLLRAHAEDNEILILPHDTGSAAERYELQIQTGRHVQIGGKASPVLRLVGVASVNATGVLIGREVEAAGLVRSP